jgi:hypothetical protein
MAKLINLIPNNQKPKTNEALEDMEVALPSKVEKFLQRLVQTIKSYNLPKKKEQAVIARVMDSMGITTSELTQAVAKLKKYDIVKRQRTGNDDADFMGENLNEAKGPFYQTGFQSGPNGTGKLDTTTKEGKYIADKMDKLYQLINDKDLIEFSKGYIWSVGSRSYGSYDGLESVAKVLIGIKNKK